MASSDAPKTITITFTPEELRATVGLLEDQLFRVKFIDPKMPGREADRQRTRSAESALERLKAAGKHLFQPHSHGNSDIMLPQKAPASPSFHNPQPRGRSLRGGRA